MADLTSSAGRIQITPHCAEHHGTMQMDFPRDTWICHGWDGEGCPCEIRSEDLEWIPVQDMKLKGIQWLT